MSKRLGVLAIALLLGACSSNATGTGTSSSASAPAATSPGAPVTTGGASTSASSLVAPSGFELVTVTVRQPDGTERTFCLWLAADEDHRERGLMHVTDPGLGGHPGMLFLFEDDQKGSFWMKNTLLPLSIAYVASDGAIVSTTDMEPCPAEERNCPTYASRGTYRYAVEVPKGRLGDLGLSDGAKLTVGNRGCT